MLTIDLDDSARRVTGKVSDVRPNSNLTTEMRAKCRNAVAEMPPEFALSFHRGGTHRTGEATLRWHDRTIALHPDSRLVPGGHVVVPLLRPPPPTPPHKGEGS